jgi:hypothetical protein
METAFDYLISQGVLGVILVLVVVYFLRKEKKEEEIANLKSRAWAELVEKKDLKIESLNDQARTDTIENMTLFNNVSNQIKELVIELKARNNG